MSTRKGTAKFLDDILRDVGDKMHEVMRTNETKYAQVKDPEQTADTLPYCDCQVLLDRSFYAPIWGRRWPDDTLVEFEYMAEASP